MKSWRTCWSTCSRRGSGLISLEKREPTLEDVFIDLVGRGLDVDTTHQGDGDKVTG